MYIKMKHLLYSKRECIYLLFAIAGVYFAATRFVGGTKSLSIYGDELGYWQGAAFFLGIDWSEIASVNEYYGCGYGLLLAPIMMIWKSDSAIMMQMAVRMQGVILSSCVLIAYRCINIIEKKMPGIYKVVLATVTVLYPSNLLFVNIVLAECILNWCIWVLFFLYLKYMKENKSYQVFLILTLSVYMYLIHARTVAVMIATFIVFFLKYKASNKSSIEKRRIVYLIIFIFFFIIGLIILKQRYVDAFYSKAVTPPQAGNLAVQVGNAINIATSFQRIVDIICSMCGKLYYVIIGSFFLVGCGLMMCIKIIVNLIKKENVQDSFAFIWLILVFMFAWGIDSLFMSSNFEHRSDILIYGRYLEYMCGPLILLGMIYVLRKPGIKYISIMVFAGLVLSVFVVGKMPSEARNSNIWISCSAIAKGFYISEDNKEALLYTTVSRCSLVFLLFFFSQFDYKKYKDIVISLLAVVGLFWILQFNWIWTEHVVPWRDDVYEKQSDLLAGIGDNNFALYDVTYPGFFQFLKVESKVYVFHSIEECINSQNIHFFISDTNCEAVDWITENANIIVTNNRYVLWSID